MMLRLPSIAGLFILLMTASAFAFETIGGGAASKWGDVTWGTGATVTWGFMPDGTDVDPDFRLDPFGHPTITGFTGTSNISQLRASVDNVHGAGAFNQAIQNAFDTWSRVANITFIGPVTDPGLPMGQDNAVTPDIRIGAFLPDATHWFKDANAIGIGPPGFPGPGGTWPESGDVIFNLTKALHIAPGIEDQDVVDFFQFGNDVEGLFLHELGHAAIGLAHPSWDGEDPDQRVMYVGDFGNPNAPFCCQSINRELHQDDINGAQTIYGPAAIIRPPCDLDGDGDCDSDDINVVYANASNNIPAGQIVIAGSPGDMDHDGDIEANDLSIFVGDLTRYLGYSYTDAAGDTDLDGDVDTSDLTAGIINFTGAGGSGKGWEQGNFDGDGDTDTSDITQGIINFTGAGAANPNVPDLIYDPATGNVTIDADGADVISFSLQGGPFSAADFGDLPAGLTDNIATQIGWTSFNLFSGMTGSVNLGAILPTGLNEAELLALLQTASYGLSLGSGGGGGMFDIIIPEPATIHLILMMVGMGIWRRRDQTTQSPRAADPGL